MPRKARVVSQSGIYHVMLRGINKQQIFEDDEDCEKFLQILRECKDISGFKLYAYCLMGNHIHLLIKPEQEPLELVFRRIAGRFVYWYNVKYQRSGHLFQDRFKSEPVETDSYFLTVIRYIHQNPIKAGFCKSVDNYKHSSFNEYKNKSIIIDSDFVFELMEKEAFFAFSITDNSDLCMDIQNKQTLRITDEQAKNLIYKYSKCRSVSDFQRLELKARDNFIEIFKKKGLSIRQISRLTGVSYYIVQKS